jgi:hypothetical protein
MTGSVAGAGAAAIAAATPAAATAAAAAAPVVDDAAKLVAPVATVASRFSGTGLLGLGAGAAGVAITLLDAWKQSMGGGQRGITADSVFNKTTMVIGGGAVLLTLGEKTGATNAFMRNGLRSAGIALVLGGLAGAIMGAVHTFGNKTEDAAPASSQSQSPVRFGTTLPPSPQNLAGIEVASADVIGEGRVLNRVPVYVDPATAKALPAGTTLGDAIGHARAAAQSDDQFRSHAVVQTADGAYWTLRLSGQLDQIDGPKYADGTKFDPRFDPQIGRRQQAVQAIAGVEGHYAFPEGMEATAPAQYAGNIPWVVPVPAGTKPTTPSTPAAPATPAAPTTTTAPAGG